MTDQFCRLCEAQGQHQPIIIREMMYGTGENFEYFSCYACGSLQISNIPVDMGRYYPQEYYSFHPKDRSKIVSFLATSRDRLAFETGIASAPVTSILKIIAELRLGKNDRILDVGCGAGSLLFRLSNIGFKNLNGIDPFLAENLDFGSIRISRNQIDSINDEYDFIMFNHSLEHVQNPLRDLLAARRRLSKSGKIMVRIPVMGNFVWREYGTDWVQIDAPRHITVPTAKGMAEAAAHVGLKLIDTIYDSWAFQFWGSEAYRRNRSLEDMDSSKFSAKEISEWNRKSRLLNKEKDGDQAAFIFELI